MEMTGLGVAERASAAPQRVVAEGAEQPLRIMLLWHSAASANLGIGALTIGHIAILRELAAVRGRALRLTVVGWAEPGEVYVHGPGISVIGLRARDLVAPRGAFARAVSEADLVIDIGAGDGFADIYGAKRIAMNLAAKSMVLALGRPLILAPQTIGPFRRAWARRLALGVIARARAMATRDALSVAALHEMGCSREIVEASDVALRLPFDPPGPRPPGPPRVGINVSGLLFNGGYTGKNMFGLVADYPALMREAIAAFQARGAEVYLVPHVQSRAMAVEDDVRVAAALAAERPGLRVAGPFSGPSEAKSFIAGLDFFTGARMHACIAALSAGVAVMPLAYSRKFDGLFGALGYGHTLDLRREESSSALPRLLAAYEARELLAGEARTAFAEGQRRLARYVDLLGAEIDGVGRAASPLCRAGAVG